MFYLRFKINRKVVLCHRGVISVKLQYSNRIIKCWFAMSFTSVHACRFVYQSSESHKDVCAN
jgi:hypothetical protein